MSELTPTSDTAVTSRARSASQWRVAAIALVALLAIGVGAALGAFLLGGAGASGFGPAASYVPADAPMYLELRAEPSAEQDAALRELLGRFPEIEGVDLSRPLYDQLTQHIDEMLQMQGAAGLRWATDVEPWFGGTVALAMTDVPTTAVGPDPDPFAPVGAPGILVLVSVTDAGAARAAADRIAADLPDELGEPTTTQHQGVEIVEVGDGAYAVTDDQLLLAPSGDVIRTALDARAAGDTIAAREGFADLMAGMPEDTLARGAWDLSTLMSMGPLGPAGSPGAAAAFERVLEDQPMRAAFAVWAAGDRLSMRTASELPSGAFAVENAERGLADEVPADVVYFADVPNAGRSWAELVAAFKDAMASDPTFAEGLAMAESALGAELEELVSWIGDGAMVAGWDGTAPYAGLLLVPTDIATAERRLGQLASFAELAAMEPASGLTVSERDVAGHAVTTIRWQVADPQADFGMAPPSAELVIEYTVTDDRALVGVGDGFVDRLLGLDPSASLASAPAYANAVAELGGASNAGVVWLELDNLAAAVDGVLGGFGVPGVPLVGSNEWFAPLDHMAGVARVDGDRLVTEAYLRLD